MSLFLVGFVGALISGVELCRRKDKVILAMFIACVTVAITGLLT